MSNVLILGILDVGGGEIMWILLLALLLFGGDKMPGIARGLGKAVSEFKKAKSDVEREITKAIHENTSEPPMRPQPPAVVQQTTMQDQAPVYPELKVPEPPQVPLPPQRAQEPGPDAPPPASPGK